MEKTKAKNARKGKNGRALTNIMLELNMGVDKEKEESDSKIIFKDKEER